MIAEKGARLEIVSPERFFAAEMGGLNLVPYMKALTRTGARITTMTRVRKLVREGKPQKQAVAIALRTAGVPRKDCEITSYMGAVSRGDSDAMNKHFRRK